MHQRGTVRMGAHHCCLLLGCRSLRSIRILSRSAIHQTLQRVVFCAACSMRSCLFKMMQEVYYQHGYLLEAKNKDGTKVLRPQEVAYFEKMLEIYNPDFGFGDSLKRLSEWLHRNWGEVRRQTRGGGTTATADIIALPLDYCYSCEWCLVAGG